MRLVGLKGCVTLGDDAPAWLCVCDVCNCGVHSETSTLSSSGSIVVSASLTDVAASVVDFNVVSLRNTLEMTLRVKAGSIR